MKKTILPILMVLLSTVSYSKDDSLSVIFNRKPIEHREINLKLSKSNLSYKDNSSIKAGGACLLIGGLAFTAASIIEGGYRYGTYKTNPNGTQTYVTPPFMQQTPRQIMLFVGIGLSLSGTIVLGSK